MAPPPVSAAGFSPASSFAEGPAFHGFVSHKVFVQLFGKSQFPYKSVNLFFILVIVKDKLTSLWGVDFCKTTLKPLCVR